MYYGIIALRDGGFYVCEDGYAYAHDALLRAENLLSAPKDLGVLGVIYITSLHAQHPCPAAIPGGLFLKPDTDKNH